MNFADIIILKKTASVLMLLAQQFDAPKAKKDTHMLAIEVSRIALEAEAQSRSRESDNA